MLCGWRQIASARTFGCLFFFVFGFFDSFFTDCCFNISIAYLIITFLIKAFTSICIIGEAFIIVTSIIGSFITFITFLITTMASNEKTDNQDPAASETEDNDSNDPTVKTPDQSKTQSNDKNNNNKNNTDNKPSPSSNDPNAENEEKNGDNDNLNRQAQQQTQSNMEKLTEMYESKTYENLKNGLTQNNYELNDLLDCNEKELRQELETHNITGIAQNKFVKAVKATRKWQEQHSQSQSNGM